MAEPQEGRPCQVDEHCAATRKKKNELVEFQLAYRRAHFPVSCCTVRIDSVSAMPLVVVGAN